ncbi:MAG: amidohydrolase family protein [Candidatus Omnitrophota bacterium]
MIIDAHCHLLPEDIVNNAHFYSKDWCDLDTQVAQMEKAGVNQAVLSYPTSDAHSRMGGLDKVVEIYNERISAVIKAHPDRFIGAAILPVGDEKKMIAEAKRATRDLGFKAFSLATSMDGIYLDDARYHALYSEAQKYNIPIFVHAQIINPIGFAQVQDPLLTPVIEYVFETTMCVGKLLMAGIFEKFPGVKFIFAYFGGVTPFLAHRYDATYTMLRRINFVKDLGALPSGYLKSIYVDTSGDTTIANFLSSLELFGPEHILWGSDYPAKRDMSASFGVLDQLNLDEKSKKNILGENLNRILKEVKL